ncbi:response regulator [Nafulsella turpanensis]|uniref:response regulator n=1 Tax=Nafulsella turpanensis TaxID=1265690 RepID=UPI0003479D45|nr:response regulator [Nafulsella turpanensis]
MKIFIIDDEEVSLFLSQRMLLIQEEDAEISLFLSAEKALKVLREGKPEDSPDVILLDINMPVIDGWKFLEHFTSMEELIQRKCSIYVLTSSLDASDEEAVKNHPSVTSIIHKPLKIEDIKLLFSHS